MNGVGGGWVQMALDAQCRSAEALGFNASLLHNGLAVSSWNKPPAASRLRVCALGVLPAAQLNVRSLSAERRVPPGNSGEQLFHSTAAKVVLFRVLCFGVS